MDLFHQWGLDHGASWYPGYRIYPGKEPEAHAPNEKTWKSHLVTCAAMYAAIPLSWLATESS